MPRLRCTNFAILEKRWPAQFCKLSHGQKGTSEPVSSLANRPRPEIFPPSPRGTREFVPDRPRGGVVLLSLCPAVPRLCRRDTVRIPAAYTLGYSTSHAPRGCRPSVTEIALSVGYETSAAFNKSFRKTLEMNPSDFRNLGKERQDEVIYDLSRPRLLKEVAMNLSVKFEPVSRPLTHYVFLEKHGPFAEVAPPLWKTQLA